MDDMNVFERQVAGEFVRRAGPVRQVDAAAIFNSIATTQSPKWRFQSMFSATKFVVAGAIVALFGGFLLSGVLTQQPSDDRLPAVGASASATAQAEATDTATSEPEPTAEAVADRSTPALLPGVDLETEAIEHGIVAVVGDGAGHRLAQPDAVEVASNTAVWVSAGPSVFRLGHAGSIATERDPLIDATVGGDLLLVAGRDVLRADATSTRGEGYPPPQPLGASGPELGGASWATAISGAPDGTAWASWSEGGAITSGDSRLVRFDGARWEDHSGYDDLGDLIDLTSDGNYICDIESGPTGETWVGVCGAGGLGFGGGGLFRHDESGWEAVQVFADVGRPDVLVSDVVAVASGADGTTWALVFPILEEHARRAAERDWSWIDEPVTDPYLGSPMLVRRRDGAWSAYRWDLVSPAADIPFDLLFESGDVMDVDDRGDLWVLAGDLEDGAERILAFDGEIVREFASVRNIRDLSIDDSGRAWLATRTGLLVVDPTGAEAAVRGLDDAVATTTPDLLPGVDLVTEEVEPGVYLVLSDGVDDLSDIPALEVPATTADSDGECRGGLLVEGECWFNAYGALVRVVDGEIVLEQVPDAGHGLTFPAQEVIGPLPGSGDTGWLVITGPTGFQGLLGYSPQGWTRVPYAADEDGQAPSIETGGGCGVVLGPARYPGLVGPDGTAWVYTLEREGLYVTAWNGDKWSSFGPVDIGTPDVEDPCLLLDAAFGPNGTMWFTTRRIPLYVITPEAVAEE